MIVAAPRAALPAELPDPDRSAEDARRAADEVLSDPAFDRPAPGVLARARDWVFDRIDEVLQAILKQLPETSK